MNKFKGNKVILVVIIGIFITLVMMGFNSKKGSGLSLEDRIKDTKKIEIYHDYHENDVNKIKPIVISDKNIIKNYLDLISKKTEQKEESSDEMRVDSQKLIFITDKEKVEVRYSYDDLYESGFITYNGEKADICYDFFRLIQNTQRYEPKEANVKEDVKNLFKKYNYTPSFLINTYKETLPIDLMYSPQKGVEELYWAYNLELSKNIGMDFSNLLSKEIEAEVYYLLEEMPKFAKPIINTTAVVVRYKGEIVGAYIDSGIVNKAIATLDGKSFEEISGSNVDEFLIKNYVDEDSELNKEVSKLDNEGLIKTYYESRESKDVSRFLSTLDIGYILSLLQPESMNLKYELFNKLDKYDSIFKYAPKTEVLEVENNNDYSKEEKEINMKIEVLEDKDITLPKGTYPMIVRLKKNDNNTYKIKDIGF